MLMNSPCQVDFQFLSLDTRHVWYDKGNLLFLTAHNIKQHCTIYHNKKEVNFRWLQHPNFKLYYWFNSPFTFFPVRYSFRPSSCHYVESGRAIFLSELVRNLFTELRKVSCSFLIFTTMRYTNSEHIRFPLVCMYAHVTIDDRHISEYKSYGCFARSRWRHCSGFWIHCLARGQCS
jgi:hypothetical protein